VRAAGLRCGLALSPGTPVQLGVRPEHLRIGADLASIPGRVALAEHLGSETILHVDAPDGSTIVVRADGLARERAGDTAPIGIPPAACHLFDANGIALLNGTAH
jgi:multiple sugar transport system ATP-binding protein